MRRILADELGIEPSAPLRQLEHKVLVQDAGLAAPPTNPKPVSDATDEPLTAPADAAPPPPEAYVRAPRGLATTALALGIVALGLFWLGVVSTLIAVLAVVCGTIAARSASTAGRPVDRRATVAIITGVVAFSASAGLLLYRQLTADSETADRTEVSNELPAEGQRTPIDMLQVGDCLNVLTRIVPPVPGADVGQVPQTVLRVPCEGPHEQEVYDLFELAAGPYPGDEQVRAFAVEQCSAQFQNYVGVTAEESELDFFYVFPDRYTWEQGYREGGCSLLHGAGLDLTGSMEGTMR